MLKKEKKQILITNTSKDGKIDFEVEYRNYKEQDDVTCDVMLALTKLALDFCDNNPYKAVDCFKASLIAFSDSFIEQESEGNA